MISKNLIEVYFIVIHHSGVLNSEKDPTSINQWKSILKNHKKEFGKKYPWSISPYHFGIGKKGDIFTGQDENFFCIHAGEDYYNFRSLAVSFLGNFNIETMNDNQLNSGIDLVKDLMEKYKIPLERVLRHKDIVTTDCPGKNFPWERFSNKLVDIPQYKYDSIEFAYKLGWIKNLHSPDEPLDFGTFLTILKNFYEVIKNGY